jgi:hypothetical protein
MREEDLPQRSAVMNRATAMRGTKCPPHGPLLVGALEKGVYVTSCLVCGLQGPERPDGWEAKLAFDEAFQRGD